MHRRSAACGRERAATAAIPEGNNRGIAEMQGARRRDGEENKY